MTVQYKKDDFLNNEENKQRFIHFLSDKLERAGCDINHAVNDADVLIIKAAVASARTKTTAVIGDDTDLLVLLLYHADASTHEVFLAPEPKQSSTRKRVWSIQKSKQLLDPRVSRHILFLHAVLGCDTTSRLFGLGKGLVPKKITSDPVFLKQAEVFNREEDVTQQDIIEAGEKALVCLYGGQDEELDVFATGGSVRKSPEVPCRSSHRPSYLHLQQQSITAYACTIK